MLKLFYVPNACSLAIHIALEWCDTEYESVQTAFGDAVLSELNPIGTVGILDRGDGSEPLTQTPAILRYLSRRFTEANVGDDGSLNGSAEMDRWLSFLVSDVHHAFHLLFNPKRYSIEGNGSARTAALSLCKRNFKVIDDHLSDREFIIGNGKSIVDAYLFPMIRWSYVKFPEADRTFANINAFHSRMLNDPAVKQAMEKEG